jgi:hypothetical protein
MAHDADDTDSPARIDDLRENIERVALLLPALDAVARRSAELRKEIEELRRDRDNLSRCFVEAEHQCDRVLQLYVASYQLHATLDPSVVKETIAQIALNLVGAEHFALILRRERDGVAEIALAEGASAGCEPFSADGIYRGGDPMIDQTLADGLLRFGPEPGSRVLCAVPLTVQGATMGALVILKLLDHEERSLEESRDLLDLLGAHAGSAFVAARAYQDSRRKLRTLEGLLDGARGPRSASLSGKLEDVSVVDVLQFIHLGRRTGTLMLCSRERRGTIGFHDGRLVSACMPGSAMLGALLLSAGAVTPALLADALAMQERSVPKPSLGRLLVDDLGVPEDAIRMALELQIEQAVFELVTWTDGSFEFATDEVHVPDDFSVHPGEVLPAVNVNTQMLLLEAMRVFDERNRADVAPGAPAAARTTLDAAPARAGANIHEMAPPAAAPATESRATPRCRVHVVSADPNLSANIAAHIADDRTLVVSRVPLREAGLPRPEERLPLVLLDLRAANDSAKVVSDVRKQHPRVILIAATGTGADPAELYRAGATAVVPADVAAVVALVQGLRRQTVGQVSDADYSKAGLARLRRIFGDLRSGMITATIGLNLMNVISENVGRAVLFLVKPKHLSGIGAFGMGSGGRPLAQLTHGMALALDHDDALVRSVLDGRARTMTCDEANLPPPLIEAVGRPRADQVAVFPVLGGDKVFAVVYADNGNSGRPMHELDIIELAIGQVGLAFENEVLRRHIASRGRNAPSNGGGPRSGLQAC